MCDPCKCAIRIVLPRDEYVVSVQSSLQNSFVVELGNTRSYLGEDELLLDP